MSFSFHACTHGPAGAAFWLKSRSRRVFSTDISLCETFHNLSSSASPKPHPSKPHSCNMPQVKTEVALQVLESCAAEAAVQHLLQRSADVIFTESCAATNEKLHCNCREVALFWVDKRVVSKKFPPERKPKRGYIRMFPRNENRNEGTFACSPGTKTGTRARSPKQPFYWETDFLPLLVLNIKNLMAYAWK